MVFSFMNLLQKSSFSSMTYIFFQITYKSIAYWKSSLSTTKSIKKSCKHVFRKDIKLSFASSYVEFRAIFKKILRFQVFESSFFFLPKLGKLTKLLQNVLKLQKLFLKWYKNFVLIFSLVFVFKQFTIFQQLSKFLEKKEALWSLTEFGFPCHRAPIVHLFFSFSRENLATKLPSGL